MMHFGLCKGFMSFSEKMSNNVSKNLSKNFKGKYSQKFLYHTKQSATNGLKTTSKKSNAKNS